MKVDTVTKKTERALEAATKAAERALGDLTEAATDLYADRKDDAEDLLREAGKAISDSVGKAGSSLLALLPSERRKRRKKAGMLTVGGLIAAYVVYRVVKSWSALPSGQAPSDDRRTEVSEVAARH